MVRTGPVIGLLSQAVLLTVLTATVGLTPPAWAAGLAYSVAAAALLSRAMTRSGAIALGPANRVTAARTVLVGAVAALVAGAATGPSHTGVLVALAATALALDAVDGRIARRTGTATALGARFDMEVDASLILVLSVAVTGSAGGWVLAIGAARYAFVAAGFVLPWLRETAPARPWCKVVAATQGVVLVTCVSGLLPGPASTGAMATALVLLAESFGRETWWLWRNRTASVPAEVSRDLLAAQL